jgi:hypothetical protein
MGRDAEALAAARQEEGRFAGFPMLRAFSTGLRAALEGHHAEASEALGLFDTFGFTDGEGLFYAAEIYARLQDVDHAFVLLARAIDAGFVCLPAFERDAYLNPLRETQQWDLLLERVRSEQRPVVDEFLERGGPTLLGRSP